MTALLASLLLAASPTLVQFETYTLPNGLTVILTPDKRLPTVGVNLWYHVGGANETPGRTGFAHLFEHLMFQGSKHRPGNEQDFAGLLEAAGSSDLNASTWNDRTNYFETLPANRLELALWLESERMAFLLDGLDQTKLDTQKDVVRNERRQSYENAPYGMASIEIAQMLYPKGHPYSWPTIGYMQDLTAASYEDVVQFFKTYYQPANASLVIAGDIDPAAVKAKVEKWFADVPAGKTHIGPIDYPHPDLTEINKKTIQDAVQLPRLYLTWITPAHLAPGDAELDVLSLLLTGGKNARLYKRLVYELQIAQDVAAFQASKALNSEYQIVVTARPDASIDRIRAIVDEELGKIQASPASSREFQRAINQIESSFYDRMERVGGGGGVADQMNSYYEAAGNPAYFSEDLSRYRALAPDDVTAAARTFLPLTRRVELVVEPKK